MAVIDYYSVDGEILGERMAGERLDYVPDAIGSIVATADGPALRHEYRYKPYGEVSFRSGTGADSAFQWVGAQGYRSTDRVYAGQYVRARHYDGLSGRWTTADAYWPREPKYGYSRANPVCRVDPTGEQIITLDPYSLFCAMTAKGFTAAQISAIDACIKGSGGSDPNCPVFSDKIPHSTTATFADCYGSLCKKGSVNIMLDEPSKCCNKDTAATSWRDASSPQVCNIVLCTKKYSGPGSEGTGDLGGDTRIPPYWFNLLHEMSHCCNNPNHGTGKTWEQCQDIMACCLFNVVMGNADATARCKRHVP